jgi:hypothetical protein
VKIIIWFLTAQNVHFELLCFENFNGLNNKLILDLWDINFHAFISFSLFQDSFWHIFWAMRKMHHTFWKKATFTTIRPFLFRKGFMNLRLLIWKHLWLKKNWKPNNQSYSISSSTPLLLIALGLQRFAVRRACAGAMVWALDAPCSALSSSHAQLRALAHPAGARQKPTHSETANLVCIYYLV